MNSQDQTTTLSDILETISQAAPPLLTRIEVQKITGGAISAKSLANLDSERKGIQPRLKIGSKVAYPTGAVIEFLKERTRLF